MIDAHTVELTAVMIILQFVIRTATMRHTVYAIHTTGSTYLAHMEPKLIAQCMCVDRKYLVHHGVKVKCPVHVCRPKVPGTHGVKVKCPVHVCRPKVPGTHGVKVKCPVHVCRPKVPGTHGVKMSGACVSNTGTWNT